MNCHVQWTVSLCAFLIRNALTFCYAVMEFDIVMMGLMNRIAMLQVHDISLSECTLCSNKNVHLFIFRIIFNTENPDKILCECCWTCPLHLKNVTTVLSEMQLWCIWSKLYCLSQKKQMCLTQLFYFITNWVSDKQNCRNCWKVSRFCVNIFFKLSSQPVSHIMYHTTTALVL